MNSLKDTELGVAIDVPEGIGMAIKAFKIGAADPAQQKLAYNFIVYDLCGALKVSLSLHGGAEALNWYNGRRFVGLQLDNIATTPLKEPEITMPPARTITQAVRRRRET